MINTLRHLILKSKQHERTKSNVSREMETLKSQHSNTNEECL